jgi:hypothetical protein
MRVIESWWVISPSMGFLAVIYTLTVGATCQHCGEPVLAHWGRR